MPHARGQPGRQRRSCRPHDCAVKPYCSLAAQSRSPLSVRAFHAQMCRQAVEQCCTRWAVSSQQCMAGYSGSSLLQGWLTNMASLAWPDSWLYGLQIGPLLQQQEAHAEFNVGATGDDILDSLTSMSLSQLCNPEASTLGSLDP